MNSLKIFLFCIVFLSSSAFAETKALLREIKNSYSPQIGITKMGQRTSLYGCEVEEYALVGKDPIRGRWRQVNFDYYKALEQRKTKNAVILLPPTGGVNIIDQGYANEFCFKNISVAVISGWDHQNDFELDLKIHDKAALRALTATRHVLEFLKDVGNESVGLLGTSVGAMTGAFAFSIDSRISTVALIVGSGHLAEVIARTDENTAKMLREMRMAKFGIKSIFEYEMLLKKNISFEPNLFLAKGKSRQALVVTADADLTVPSSFQYDFAKDIGADVHIQLRGGHIPVIKKAFYHYRDDIVGFFQVSFAK